jgi:hypothetical protein
MEKQRMTGGLHQNGQHSLHPLYICESLDKLIPRILQTIHTLAKKEIRDDVDSHTVKKILDIKGLTRSRELSHHNLRPFLKYVQIGDTVLNEHGTDEIAAVLP